MKSALSRLEKLRFFSSLYGLPILIATLVVFAMFFLESSSLTPGTPMSVRAFADVRGSLPVSAVATQKWDRAPVSHVDTRRAEHPFWLRIRINNPSKNEPTEIEFPSKHTRSLTCWRADDLGFLGHADRGVTNGSMRIAKAGFALGLRFPDPPAEVLCRSTYRGPARISILQWSASSLDLSIAESHRRAGLLEGGLMTLAAFMFVTALINKEWIYVLFASWLVANLRLGLISIGWDTQIIGLTIPLDLNEVIRKVTIPLYYILTAALFGELFKSELKRLGNMGWLRAAEWLGYLLLVIALTQPVVRFLPMMWVIVSFGIAVLVVYLVRVLIWTRSRVAIWYTASLLVVLFSGMSEVLGAAFGLKIVMSMFNSVSAALLSSLIAAFAIAEQLRSERSERLLAEAELRHVYDSTPVGLFTLSEDGTVLRANPAMERMLGRSFKPTRSFSWDDCFGSGAFQTLRGVALRDADLQLSTGLDRLEGKTFLAKASLVESRIEGSLQDITERAHALRQLVFLAENDGLTGIANRRAIEGVLQSAIKSQHEDSPVALAYLDLDRFKLINDLFGHQAGDEVLKQVCQRTLSVLGPGHRLGRVGGDEFVIVFSDTDIREAKALSREVIDKIGNEPYQVGVRAFQVNGSIGLIEVTRNLGSADAISAADRACREAKKGQVDHLVVYENNAPAFQDRADELRLIEELGNQNDDFKSLYLEMQPIMSLQTPHEAKDFEILLRMRGPDGSIIPAWKVVPIAEQHGFIAKIDRWVLRTALEWMENNRTRLKKTRFICVNLSGGSLNDERFINDTFDLLAQHRDVLPLLCIEVTESVALHDLDNTVRFIDRIREYGAKVALDDFGAGYTSFSYLKALSADAIKIDGSFIKNMCAHPADISIVAAIVELARNLGLKSIAEWVEDQATLELLAEIGIDYVQGYLLARPQMPEDILEADSAASFIVARDTATFVRSLPLRSPRIDVMFDGVTGPLKMVH